VIPGVAGKVTSAALLCFALFLSIVDRIWRFDQRQSACRVLAENVKSAGWQYLMDTSTDEEKRRSAFRSELEAIRERLPEYRAHLAETGIQGDYITPSMRTTASLGWAEKLDLYQRHRIEDQLTWYTRGAATNGRLDVRWSISMLFLEFTATVLTVIAAILRWNISPAAPLAAVAAAGLAWVQTQRFASLASAYRTASEDLQRPRDTTADVHDEASLGVLVRAVEQAICKERGVWRAQRGV
jgi:hypothetical protein